MADRLRQYLLGIAAAAALGAIAVLSPTGSGIAQEEEAEAPGAERDERARELETVAREMEEAREAESLLAEELESLKADSAALNARLIATADSVRQKETSLAVLEGRIAALVDREHALRISLRSRSGLLAELLGALQRMGRRPPPAVIVSPEDALKTVRSAMLLGAVLPELRIETEALASDLHELVRLKEEIEAEKTRLAADTRLLDSERRRIAMLIDAKRETIETRQEGLSQLRERTAELADQAQDLKELIASLERETAVAERQDDEAAAERELTPQEALAALRDPARIEPGLPFDQAKGLLSVPASGAIVRTFGASDEYGAAAKGISIATRPGGQVTSPSDGWVVYAGPFRSYGQLLILNAGDGYHVLLAGMETIAVDLGQFVLAGEPVGRMGELVLASAEDVTVGGRQSILYVEFRKDGRSIDPAPWWADGPTGVGG